MFETLIEKIDILAIVIFMFSMIIVTEMFKPLLKKITFFNSLIEKTEWFNLILSWLVGSLAYFFLIHKTLHREITSESIIQFAFWTLLANGGYKKLKPIIKKLYNLKSLEK